MSTLLQINSTCNSGSTGRIAEQISLLAQSKGWDCYIAHGNRGNNPSKVHNIPVVSPFDEKIHGVYTRLFDMHGLASKRATLRLIDTMKDIHPDVVHLHNIHGYYLNYEVLFRYLASVDVPIVWTLHDCWSFTGHCAHFDYVGCEKWKYGCSACPQINSYPKSLFVDNSKNNYRRKKASFTSVKNMTIVPVSEWLGGLVKQSFLREYPLQVIHNGIDLRTFNPEAKVDLNDMFGTKGKKYIVGVAAPWTERKGLKDVIDLSERLDNEKYQILLVGMSKKQILDLPHKIIGIERTQSAQELANYYAGADVFINPTYEDTFPTTNLEALACGTPIITYRTGGSPEAIGTSSCGLVVDKGNVKDLAEAVQLVNKTPQFSAVCRKRAEDCFNRVQCFEKYLDLYETLLQ